MTEASPARSKIFLSYSHHDVTIVNAVHERISARHDVFIDSEIEPGAAWPKEIEDALTQADIFIVFLSEHAVTRNWVLAETSRALVRQEETQKPRIVPVFLNFNSDPSVEVHALVGRLQPIRWYSDQDTADIVEELEKICSGAWVPRTPEAPPALSRYLVSAARAQRIRETFVEPPDAARVRALLHSKRVLWITGPAGSGKEFLASAIACESAKPVFELRRKVSWLQMYQNRPAGSVIVIPDALAPERAGNADFEDALPSLRKICAPENTLILTCTEEEFSSRRGLLTDVGFDDATLTRHRVTPDTYSVALRTRIVQRHIQQAVATGLVSAKQQQWAEELLRNPAPWQAWTMGELETFATQSLAIAQNSGDVARCLSQQPSLEEQVHAWFLNLDEAARSLLLALLLFPEASQADVWSQYRVIVSELASRQLTPQIAIPTLGICRSRCRPYVTQTDDVEIVEMAAVPIAHELASTWREYILELRTLLIRWSDIEGSASVRSEVARLLGELMAVRTDDVMSFLETFAASEDREMRIAAADAFVHAFGHEKGVAGCQKLLRRWENDRSGDQETVRKRMTAANACWRIAAMHPDGPHYAFSMEQLHRHVRDVEVVRATVAYGLNRLVARSSGDADRILLNRLAADQDPIVRRRAGVAFAELSHRDWKAAGALFETWLESNDRNRLWTAAYALMVAKAPGRDDRARFLALMDRAPIPFADAVASSITPGKDVRDTDNTRQATERIAWVASQDDLAMHCAKATGSYWTTDPQLGAALCVRLGNLDSRAVMGMLVRACAFRLAGLRSIAFPEAVLAEVHADVKRRQVTTGAMQIIVRYAEEHFDAAFVEGWAAAGDLIERFFDWLRTDLPDTGQKTVVLLRQRVLESLYGNPQAVLKCAVSWLRTRKSEREATAAIEEILANEDWYETFGDSLFRCYWQWRDDVGTVLAACDGPKAVVVRRFAFADLLQRDRRLFVEAAIRETRESGREKDQVLRALADLAQTKGTVIAAAIRAVVWSADPVSLTRLIADFDASSVPSLRTIVGDLWVSRFWLFWRRLAAGLRA